MLRYMADPCEKATPDHKTPNKRSKRHRLPGGPVPTEQIKRSNQRTEDAVQMIAQGLPRTTIVQKIMVKDGCSLDRAYVAYRRGRQQLTQIARAQPLEERLAESIAHAEAMIQDCKRNGEYGAGVAALKWLGELQGVTAAQQQWEQEREAKHMLTIAQAAALFARAQRDQIEGRGELEKLADELKSKTDGEILEMLDETRGKLVAVVGCE